MTEPHCAVPVAESSQPFAVRSEARRAAERLRLDEEDAYRAGLVATELATNLVKHAVGGEVLVRAFRDDTGDAVEMIAVDRGPGMANAPMSLADGVSSAGTLGTGLGGVRRLADEFDLHSQPGRGTVVLARVRRGRPGVRSAQSACAGVSVPFKGEPVCGDGWTIRAHDHGFAVLLVDGLGHGLSASAAADAALAVFTAGTYSSALEMLRLIHLGLMHTRGAAATIVDVRPAAATAIVIGIGNVATVVCHGATAKSGITLPGILGHQARQFREFSYAWRPDSLLVVHSDGLTTRWTMDTYQGLQTCHPAVIASVLYRDCSRGRDDATVVVARSH